MKLSTVTLLLCTGLLLSGCADNDPSNNDTSPIGDDNSNMSNTADSTEPPDDNETNDTPTLLQTPRLLGELSFVSEQTVDLDPMLDEAGLERATNFVLANDGTSVRAEAVNDQGLPNAILYIDTVSAIASWMATDIDASTRILFNDENNAVAAFGIECADPIYTPVFENSLLNLSNVIPPDRCLSDDAIISADGNVIVFETYIPDGFSGERNHVQLQAYTLNTASLNTLPYISLVIDNVTLNPLTTTPFGYERILSNDGQQYLLKQEWSGIDAQGNVVRQVGAIIWTTNSADWVIRGQAANVVDCSPSLENNCNTPYYYAMSSNGLRQYFTYPTSELIDDGTGPARHQTLLATASTGTPSATQLEVAGTIRSLDTNLTGDLLLLNSVSGSERVQSGYALFQQSSSTLLSLNDTLNGCSIDSNINGSIESTDCDFSVQPFSTSGDAEKFTADGKHLLMRFISRFTEEHTQSIDDFILDIDDNAAYTLPMLYSADPDWVNSNASVFLGNTEFPDYDVLIGRR